MSLQQQMDEAAGERSGFFIGSDPDNVLKEEDHHQIILQKANALASENCLKEAIDWFSVALRYGPVRPEQLSTFVDCILRNFKRNATEPDNRSDKTRGGGDSSRDVSFDCPNCHSFLGEPVTIACGHSYCKRCLQRRLLSKCKLCSETVTGEEKVNVILCGLLDKWFHEELKTSKLLNEVDELCRRKCYHEAVSLASDVIQCGKCCAYSRIAQVHGRTEFVIGTFISPSFIQYIFTYATCLLLFRELREDKVEYVLLTNI